MKIEILGTHHQSWVDILGQGENEWRISLRWVDILGQGENVRSTSLWKQNVLISRGRKWAMTSVTNTNVLHDQWGDRGCTQEVKVFFSFPTFGGCLGAAGREVIDHIAHGIYSKPLRFVKSTPTSSQCALHRFLRNDFDELIMKQVHHQPKQPPLEGKIKL